MNKNSKKKVYKEVLLLYFMKKRAVTLTFSNFSRVSKKTTKLYNLSPLILNSKTTNLNGNI